MPNITYKSCLYLLILQLEKFSHSKCNFDKEVFQIKLKYLCSQPIKLQKCPRWWCNRYWKWRVIIAAKTFQCKQLEGRSLKNITASTGFEPVTSATPVRCSTNWAVKPHIRSEVNLLSSYLPVQWNMNFIYISHNRYWWKKISYVYNKCRLEI